MPFRLLFTVFFFLISHSVAAEQVDFIFNGDLSINCHDGTLASEGQSCAKSVVLSSDWSMRILRETHATSELMLSGSGGSINTTIPGWTPRDSFSVPGDRIRLEIFQNAGASGDSCFYLGDVWAHLRDPHDPETSFCRFLVYKDVGEVCLPPGGVASQMIFVPHIPDGCDGNLSASATVENESIEVGEELSTRISLLTSTTGVITRGCWPGVLHYKDLALGKADIGTPLDETTYGYPSSITPGGCTPDYPYVMNPHSERHVEYVGPVNKPGVVSLIPEVPFYSVFETPDATGHMVFSDLNTTVVTVTGGLRIQALAPESIPADGEVFDIQVSITNQGQKSATLPEANCYDYVYQVACSQPDQECSKTQVILPLSNQPTMAEVTLAGGQSHSFTCSYLAISEGSVDFSFATTWEHQSGNPVFTDYSCDSHPQGGARCFEPTFQTDNRTVVRVGIGPGGECGDGIIDESEQCDGGDCCTEECTYRKSGELCQGESICAESNVCDGLSGECRGADEDPSIESVEFSLLTPLGSSPVVLSTGWEFGVNATAQCSNGLTRDLSSYVEWSGTGTFSPSQGVRSRPSFSSPGINSIRFEYAGASLFADEVSVTTKSASGFAAVGDEAFCPADSHGAPTDPHAVQGPILRGSTLVTLGGAPAARIGDPGEHAACSGPNSFVVAAGDPEVSVLGRALARHGDATSHCGGNGSIISPKLSLPSTLSLRSSGSGQVSGRVTGPNGAPLYGIAVSLFDGTGNIYTAWSDELGDYVIDSLPAGSFTLECNGATVGLPGIMLRDGVGLPPKTLSLGEGASLVGQNCTLPTGGVLAGVVTDTALSPVSGVWVHARPTDPTFVGSSVLTSADGSYSLSGLLEGTYRVFVSGSEEGFEDTYYPNSRKWEQARILSVKNGQTQKGLAIRLSLLNPYESCSSTSLILQEIRLAQLFREQHSLVTKASRVYKKAARGIGEKFKKRIKKAKKKANILLEDSSAALQELPPVSYSDCGGISPECVSTSNASVKSSLLLFSQRLFRETKKLVAREKKLRGSNTKRAKKTRKKARKFKKELFSLVEALPGQTVSCS